MSFGLKMNSLKMLVVVNIIVLIMLLILPIQSMPTDDAFNKLSSHHKRWTFNTWRLHGRRQLPNSLFSIFD